MPDDQTSEKPQFEVVQMFREASMRRSTDSNSDLEFAIVLLRAIAFLKEPQSPSFGSRAMEVLSAHREHFEKLAVRLPGVWNVHDLNESLDESTRRQWHAIALAFGEQLSGRLLPWFAEQMGIDVAADGVEGH